MADVRIPFDQGGDQQLVAEIARNIFGGYPELYRQHNWPWPGNQAMNQAATNIVREYGSVAEFQAAFEFKGVKVDPFSGDPEIWLTSFWGWSPETWGCVGFTQEGRRRTFCEASRFPLLMVVYITEGAPNASADERGKVAGFYEVFNLPGDRNAFVAPEHHSLEPGKWTYSLKALRAFEILPEFRPHIRQFDPSIREEGRELSVAKSAARLNADAIERLKALPFREVNVFGINRVCSADMFAPLPIGSDGAPTGYVSGGAGRRSGYEVGEPEETEKELYVLKLSGDPEAFLGHNCDDRSIFKVGLSLSPQTRAMSFNKAMPRSAFSWSVHRSNRLSGFVPYSTFQVAEKGEMKMKQTLGRDAERHLGGEFYLATEAEIDNAWTLGRKEALRHEGKGA